MPNRKGRWLLAVPALGAATVLASVGPAGASSHREAPLISQDPPADNTDVYAFRSPDKPDTVTLIANVYPFEDPAGGPNFYRFGDDVVYRFHVDNNGDAKADQIYDFRFSTHYRNTNTFLYNTGPVTSPTDPDLNIYQTYSVERVVYGKSTQVASGFYTPPNNVGPVSTPNYAATAQKAIYNAFGGKVFAGQRDDPFFVDLGAIFDLGQLRPFLPAYKPAPRSAMRGKDGLGGYNVQTIALQLPITALTHNGRMPTGPNDPNAVIGVWSTTWRQQTRVLHYGGHAPTYSGNYVQVSRLGNPLVNEVIIPLKDKDKWNNSHPIGDGQFLSYVQKPELAGLITALYGVKVPPNPRNDLVTIFLTGIPGLNQPKNVVPSEEMRLNVAVKPTAHPNPLGVLGGDNAGFPNGRRLGDDVTDIELRALAGGTPFTPQYNKSPNNDLGDGVNSNDKPFLSSFPYVATPWQGFQDTHGTPGSTMPIPLKP